MKKKQNSNTKHDFLQSMQSRRYKLIYDRLVSV